VLSDEFQRNAPSAPRASSRSSTHTGIQQAADENSPIEPKAAVNKETSQQQEKVSENSASSKSDSTSPSSSAPTENSPEKSGDAAQTARKRRTIVGLGSSNSDGVPMWKKAAQVAAAEAHAAANANRELLSAREASKVQQQQPAATASVSAPGGGLVGFDGQGSGAGYVGSGNLKGRRYVTRKTEESGEVLKKGKRLLKTAFDH
jgi:cytoskeletal protein RodZ